MPGRNAPCWCGSGQKYKRCHLHREAERRLPLAAVTSKARTASEHKVCLHPDASDDGCDKIVSAHTIQRAGTLERIVDNGQHVLGFDPMRRDKHHGLQLCRVGWRQASTFAGFCAKHDSSTFAPLETRAFVASPEQCFLLAYRALCHEIHQKRAARRALPVLRALGDRGYPAAVQAGLQHDYGVITAGTRRGLDYFDRLKSDMDSDLLKADFSRWSRLVIHFQGEISVTTCGVVSPNRDLDGNTLQILHDQTNSEQEPLFCSVVSTIDECGAVVFSWLRHHTAPRRFVQSLLAQGERMPAVAVQFFFAFISNTYFSPGWWKALSRAETRHVHYLASIANAYSTDFAYADLGFVTWRITRIERGA